MVFFVQITKLWRTSDADRIARHHANRRSRNQRDDGRSAGDADAARDAQRALDDHGVVVYREIHISDDQLLAFSRLLGTLVVQPTGEHVHPEIQTITMDPTKTNALLASYRQGNLHWHIDGATDDRAPKGHPAHCAGGRSSRR